MNCKLTTRDTVIDYKVNSPLQVIPHGSVDILFDTIGTGMSLVKFPQALLLNVTND
jgi:hypothetical protein